MENQAFNIGDDGFTVDSNAEVVGLRMVQGYDILAARKGSRLVGSLYHLTSACAIHTQVSKGAIGVSVAPLTPLSGFNPNLEKSVFMDVTIDSQHVLFTYTPNDDICMKFKSMVSGIILSKS